MTENENVPAKDEPKDEMVTVESKLKTKIETVVETKDEPAKEGNINLFETEVIEEKVLLLLALTR